jgi:hypothetical protein
MTPLAAYLAKQIIARPKHRVGAWRDPKNIDGLRTALHDIHCFEITQCGAMIFDMMKVYKDPDSARALFDVLGFLPAPKTWIEWKPPRGGRVALLIGQVPDAEGFVKDVAYTTAFSDEGLVYAGRISPSAGKIFVAPEYRNNTDIRRLVTFALYVLPIINSPKIIGRQQHMPNRALERKLTRGFGVGRFPLHAWTEIKLEVSKPPEIDDGEPHEAHLTGRRALHFCRKHIRIRNGQLEYVRAHWRGDPALGIKRSRYLVSA